MKKLFFIIGVVGAMCACGQRTISSTSDTHEDVQRLTNERIFHQVSQQVEQYKTAPFNTLLIAVAECFLETPYVASTLEIEPETLQVFLDKTDCILFVELCTTCALTIRGDSITPDSIFHTQPSYNLLCHNIQHLRYRNGLIDGYASRIHYTSEWIQQGTRNGLFTEITESLGGKEYTQHFNFMSTHPQLYKQLTSDTLQTGRIRNIEEGLEANKPYYYLSFEQLQKKSVLKNIHSGDIICFKDTHEGLDIAHVSLAYTKDDTMYFIHASSKAKKVIINDRPLNEYATNGIRVVRFNDNL